jgi:hypothetical protein
MNITLLKNEQFELLDTSSTLLRVPPVDGHSSSDDLQKYCLCCPKSVRRLDLNVGKILNLEFEVEDVGDLIAGIQIQITKTLAVPIQN